MKLSLDEVAPGLDIGRFHEGTRFVDKANPVYEGGSDLAYDYSTLLEEGLIEATYLKHDINAYGEPIPSEPGIKITQAGLDLVMELDKSWLQRGIEKEPMTFAGVVVAVVIAVISALGGWIVGRQTAPSPECPPVSGTSASPTD